MKVFGSNVSAHTRTTSFSSLTMLTSLSSLLSLSSTKISIRPFFLKLEYTHMCVLMFCFVHFLMAAVIKSEGFVHRGSTTTPLVPLSMPSSTSFVACKLAKNVCRLKSNELTSSLVPPRSSSSKSSLSTSLFPQNSFLLPLPNPSQQTVSLSLSSSSFSLSPPSFKQPNDGTNRSTFLRLSIPTNMKSKKAFVAGVGDSHGYGWAIAKQLAEAGVSVSVGTWPPVFSIFKKSYESGKFDDDRILSDGSMMNIENIYALDATFDFPEQVPQEVRENKRYAGLQEYTISEVARKYRTDNTGLDILIHSLANGPEVTRPLLETSRNGYLTASSSSAYSFVSLLQHFAPIMRPGGSAVTLSYIASEAVIPGYGGGMSSAKAQLESDTRTLAWECGRRYKIRVNCISAGPLKSRAASAIGSSGKKSFIDYAIDYSFQNAPLRRELSSQDIGKAALFLSSDLASGITGATLYVDNGLHAMGQAVDSLSLQKDISTSKD